MLLVKDKWDTYAVENERGDEWAALDLLRQRVEDDFWYNNWDDGDPEHQYDDRAKKIVELEDAPAALRFLIERRDAEYEWVEVQQPRRL
jgi:hypothetical protein